MSGSFTPSELRSASCGSLFLPLLAGHRGGSPQRRLILNRWARGQHSRPIAARSVKRGYCAHEAAWGLTCMRMFILMLQQLWAHPPFPKPSTPAHLKQMGSRAAQQTYCSRSAKRGYCAHEAAWGLTCAV